MLLPTSERLDTPLKLRRAPWLRAKEAEARGLRAAVGWLEDTTRPDEPVLVLPRDPLVYFLADRANASPYPLKLPGAFQLEGFEAALARVDTVMVRDTGHDELPLFRLMPEVWQLLRRDFVVAEPYLDRLQIAGGPPPEMQPIFAMRRRAATDGASAFDREPDLELLEGLMAAPPTILNPELGAFAASPREQPRLVRAQWLLEPAVLLRPPSGWQKFGVAVRGRPTPGSVLRFQVALRPPQLHDRWLGADGSFFEVLAWDPERRSVERLHLESLDAREHGVWRWRGVAVPLERYAGREVVLVLAATPGPSLREIGDEVLVSPPWLEQTGPAAATTDHPALSAVSLLSLPRPALLALARFDDPAPFAAALSAAGKLPPERRARIHLALGLAQARSGEVAAGREEVSRACALAPRDAEARLAAAELAAAAGDVDDALRRYAELLELRPDHARALAMSAGYALDRGDLSGARVFAARADRPDAGLDTRLLLARLRQAEGDSVGAGAELLRAAAQPGDTGVALELLNQWFAGEVARIGDAYLTRVRVPMPDDAFVSEVEISELPVAPCSTGTGAAAVGVGAQSQRARVAGARQRGRGVAGGSRLALARRSDRRAARSWPAAAASRPRARRAGEPHVPGRRAERARLARAGARPRAGGHRLVRRACRKAGGGRDRGERGAVSAPSPEAPPPQGSQAATPKPERVRRAFTGERLHAEDPRTRRDVGPDLFAVDLARHRAAYRHAAETWRMRVMPERGPGRVLDLGCGAGYGTSLLASSLVDLDALVLGYDRELPDRASRGTGARFVRGEVEALPFASASCDLVASFQVIEHLENPERYVHEVARVLAPDGLSNAHHTESRDFGRPQPVPPSRVPRRRAPVDC